MLEILARYVPPELRKTLLIAAVIFISLFFFGGRMIYEKNINRILKYRQQRKRTELENKVAKQLTELKKIREGMKPIKGSSQFLAEVAKLAGRLNMKLITIAAQPVEKRNEFTKFGVQLEVDTTYHELGNFVSMLESDERIINVDVAKIITTKMTPEGSARINVVLDLSTFALKTVSLEI